MFTDSVAVSTIERLASRIAPSPATFRNSSVGSKCAIAGKADSRKSIGSLYCLRSRATSSPGSMHTKRVVAPRLIECTMPRPISFSTVEYTFDEGTPEVFDSSFPFWAPNRIRPT